jgi:predicted outer membrane repeat protein
LTVVHSTLAANTVGCGGGAIWMYASKVLISHSTLSDNHSDGCQGGAIYSLFATLTVASSTIANNSVLGYEGDGGGIFAWGGNDALRVTNSTITGNLAAGRGGGIYGEGLRVALVADSTVYGNTAAEGGGVSWTGYGRATLRNSIAAGNLASGAGPDCLGAVFSQGYNLIGNDAGCAFAAGPGDLVGTPAAPIDPLLGPLQNNGGPTWTHALLAASPAVDAGTPTRCPPTDQRGYLRPVDGDGDGNPVCDIGAFEFGASPPVGLAAGQAGYGPQ